MQPTRSLWNVGGGEGFWGARRGGCSGHSRTMWYTWPCEKVLPFARRQSPPRPHTPTVSAPFYRQNGRKRCAGVATLTGRAGEGGPGAGPGIPKGAYRPAASVSAAHRGVFAAQTRLVSVSADATIVPQPTRSICNVGGGEGFWGARRGGCSGHGRAMWYIWPCEKVLPFARRRSPPIPHPHRKSRPFYRLNHVS